MDSGVSVIIAVRNGARFLAQALDSIFQQTSPPEQVIVVDGQSDDGTGKIACSRPVVQFVVQDVPGLARARNLGIQHAREEFVAFLDHDDLWMSDKLRTQVVYMRSHPELAFTTTHFEWFRDPKLDLSNFPVDRRLLSLQAAPTPSTLVARRTAFEQNGLFDQELAIVCDSEWFARARRQGVASATIPRVLLRKRLHDTNLSRGVEQYRCEWLRVLHLLCRSEAMVQ
jgi:glycosyltransferase involved in cell wall biosynthesis